MIEITKDTKDSRFSLNFARRALVARSVAVEGLALRACTLRSLFSVLLAIDPLQHNQRKDPKKSRKSMT